LFFFKGLACNDVDGYFGKARMLSTTINNPLKPHIVGDQITMGGLNYFVDGIQNLRSHHAMQSTSHPSVSRYVPQRISPPSQLTRAVRLGPVGRLHSTTRVQRRSLLVRAKMM